MQRHHLGVSAALVLVLATAALAGDDDVRVVVGFKSTVDESVVRDRGGKVEEKHPRLGAVVAVVPPGKLAALRADSAVAYVEEDGIAEALGKPDKGSGGGSAAESLPWGVQKVWGANAINATAAGVTVAIIDTGIDLNHPDLSANVQGGVSFVSGNTDGDDDNGHGSHVAGTVAAVDNTIGVIGVATGAHLYAVKTLDRRGSGYLSAVAAGVDWAAQNGMNVANMSLGTSADYSVLKTACANAETAGVLLVAAAGNSGDGNVSTTETSYPAAYTSVVAVGATTSLDGLASFSNTGSYVEVSAPGVSIPSTYKSGGYKTLSGTSMATPHVAGLAALIWAELTSPTVSSVRTELRARVRDDAKLDGRDNGFGEGIVSY